MDCPTKGLRGFSEASLLYLEAYRFRIAPVSELVFHSLFLVGSHAAHFLFGGINRRIDRLNSRFGIDLFGIRRNPADRACGAALLAAVRQRFIIGKHFLGSAAEQFVTGILKNPTFP